MITAWKPETLDLDRLIDRHGRRLAEAVVLLGDQVFTRLAVDPRCRDAGLAPLSAVILRRLLGRYTTNPARLLAESIGYVARDRSYSPGRFSQGYRIGREFAHARLGQYTLRDPGLLENIRRERERMADEQAKRLADPSSTIAPDVFDHLYQNLQKLRIDRVQPKSPVEQIVIDRIRRRASWCKPCDYGRLHTVLTSTPRRLRPYLHVGGKRLVGVDVGESQPLFIALGLTTHHRTPPHTTNLTTHHHTPHPHQAAPLMLDDNFSNRQKYSAQRGACPTMLDKRPERGGSHAVSHAANAQSSAMLSADAPADLAAWLRLCERRALYQAVADVLEVERKPAKDRVMAVLFGEPRHRTRASKALESMFPATWAAIVGLKLRSGYAALAYSAQKAEGRFIFGQCIGRLMDEYPDLLLLTIHDSIVTTEGDERIVEAVMREEFDRLGLKPTLSIEPFRPVSRLARKTAGPLLTSGRKGR